METLKTICNNQSYDEPSRRRVPQDLLHIQRTETSKYITDITEIYTTTHDFWNKPYEFFSIYLWIGNIVFSLLTSRN
jgi:hypothetical protein